ncbi:hypothetical protein [Kushneria phosphatilytica]|uniref:Uncharacterized protein n=1 Tax=Kushneria phosphatilytica TaxID=657387 RepID=A0A1S1NRL6_9GAMM|nr:hypothetical protein [Kushneria phosphatilytica]OHV07560.1 hypothetical protein BH688_15180 [Kushneria phosphatilytica]QEL10045.1 hypothetical protein FY550_02120 [Kushneria phosphatilytica]
MLTWATAFWSWLTANAAVFSGIVSFGMLLIWGIYLQLLLHNFRVQQSPRIVINRGRGRDINSLCLISNMSVQAIFVEAVVVQLETSHGTWFSDVTDVLDQQGESSSRDISSSEHHLARVTRQGPLKSGDYMEAGMFGDLIQQVAREQGIHLDEKYTSNEQKLELRSLEIGLIAVFGSENGPIGAQRIFDLELDDNQQLLLKPRKLTTKQLYSRRSRMKIKRWQKVLR